MHIEIDYNGSYAVCKITLIVSPTEQMVNFNNADEMAKVFALSAMRCVKEYYDREKII